MKAAITALGSTPAQALITSGTTTAMATLDLALTGGFDAYDLVLTGFEPVTAGQNLLMRLAYDGVPTFVAGSAYYQTGTYTTSASTTISSWSGSAANSFAITRTQAAVGGNASQATIRLMMGSAQYSSIDWSAIYCVTGSDVEVIKAGGHARAISTRPTHLRLIYNSGNIAASGKYKLYGLRS